MFYNYKKILGKVQSLAVMLEFSPY